MARWVGQLDSPACGGVFSVFFFLCLVDFRMRDGGERMNVAELTSVSDSGRERGQNAPAT
ncbi:hypothetical protein CWC46_06840 [Prodigiosinella confusarubida]|uniref:Uncharacterized protein n=1 Tax=Serratia sp. (strain ATCC 39006) TaxID=104623 RepID=A0A2I5T4Q7_SERS3|nr:hypothetical protein CWC46_06840 [Serratia sp. ATCC 39006]AUH03877.1 hypothetical protein Ser39006_006845 [Serratia sp. ATCC 39006]